MGVDTLLSVSHLRRSTKDDIEWVFSETADIEDTDREQLLMRHVMVKYNCEKIIIGCRIENPEMIIEINSKLTELRNQ